MQGFLFLKIKHCNVRKLIIAYKCKRRVGIFFSIYFKFKMADILGHLDGLNYKQFVLYFSCIVYGFEQYLK